MQKTVVNLSLGTVETVDLNADEIAEREAMQPTPEQLLQAQRAQMTLSPANARLKLAALGLLDTVNNAIAVLPDSNPLKIKWEYATQIERLDSDLAAFCQRELSLSDTDIDNLFLG